MQEACRKFNKFWKIQMLTAYLVIFYYSNNRYVYLKPGNFFTVEEAMLKLWIFTKNIVYFIDKM